MYDFNGIRCRYSYISTSIWLVCFNKSIYETDLLDVLKFP